MSQTELQHNGTAAAEGHTETGIDAIKSSVSFGDWFLKLKKYKCEGLPLSRNVLSLLYNIDNWQTRDDWSLNYTSVFHFQSFIHPPPTTHLSLASLSQSSDYHLSGFGCQFINRWLLCLQRNLLLRPLFKALVGKQEDSLLVWVFVSVLFAIICCGVQSGLSWLIINCVQYIILYWWTYCAKRVVSELTLSFQTHAHTHSQGKV